MLLPAPDALAGGFEACVRVFHPAELEGAPVTWQEIAAHFGTVAHPRMEFEPLARRATWNYAPGPGLFDRPPPTDWLPTSVVQDALRVLRRHTATTEQC